MILSVPRLMRALGIACPFVLVGSSRAAEESAPIPTGWLTATPGLVKVGSLPTLKWDIQYPATVADYVDIEGTGTIVPKQKMKMELRVLGAGVTSSRADGSNLSFVHTEAYTRYNGSGWRRVFQGTNPDVRQSQVVDSATLEPQVPIKFGARFWHPNGYWSTLYSSNDGTRNVRVLLNGDAVPTTYPIATAPSLEDFIKPYLDAGGKVRIGPMDAIVMMELTHTDAQASQQGYDLQDMVFLVTFKPE